MNEHHDVVTVTRVSESSNYFGFSGVDETLGGILGFEEEEENEIMVEVVGSDVFFDGVGGNEIGSFEGDGVARDDLGSGEVGNETVCRGFEDAGTLGDRRVDVAENELDVMVNESVVGDIGIGSVEGEGVVMDYLGLREVRIETVCRGFEDAGTLGKGDCHVDVVGNESDSIVNVNVVGEDGVKDDVNFVMNGDGMESRDEVTGNGDMSCILTTPSSDEAMSCKSEASGKTEGVTEIITCGSNEESIKQTVEPFDALVSQIAVVGNNTSNTVTDSGNTHIITEFVDQRTEAVGLENEMLNKEESLHSGRNITKSGGHGKDLQYSAEGQMNNNMVAENAGGYADLGVDTVSSHKPADLVLDSKDANDDQKVFSEKDFETSGTVSFSEGKGYYGEGTQAFISEGKTSNEVVNLAFESSENKPMIGSLVENMGTCVTEEGKNSQGGQLEGDISLTYDISCLHSNDEGIFGDFDLQYSECLDSSGIFSGLSSDPDHILEVEEENKDAKQYDVRTDQEMEVEDDAMNIQKSDDIDEKISDLVSPRSGSSISEFHSRYLLPPKTEGEFSVSDLVWGKVRNHSWWPGQILKPADASEKALKYHKKECFLVAYFGDRSFAWNDAFLLRPFKTHFSEIEKQRNSEALYHAVSCALAEVSRRVELGLTCSCLPKNSVAESETQILERTGIHQEGGRRYGMDESVPASSFEPGELLEHIRTLALFPSRAGDERLQLVISKAQLSIFSRFKGQRPLPEFQLGRGLMENDTNTSKFSKMLQEDSEQIRGANNTCSKRRRDATDSLIPKKKERSMSDLIGDISISESADEVADKRVDKSVASSAGRKRRALDSITDGSYKQQSYYAAKVSRTASQSPNSSFKVGECIRRVASQLNGSSSNVKCDNEKFLKVDDSVYQQPGFDCSPQSPMYSQRGTMIISLENSSLGELLSQLRLAALDPQKRYSFLNNVSNFFPGFRESVALGQSSRRRNPSVASGARKKKPPHALINSPEDFEFDDVNDSYWTDRMVENHGEEQQQLLNIAQVGEAEHLRVLYEKDRKKVDKSLKSSRRSRGFSNRDLLMVEEEPVSEDTDSRRPDCSPAELILKFTDGNSIPSELNLNKIFKRFGPLREPETEVDRETSRAKVVFKRCSDAEVAFSSAGKINIFGPIPVSFELRYVLSASFKTLSARTLQVHEDAS